MKKRAKVYLLPTEPSSAEACIGVRGNIMAYHLAIHHLALSKFYHIYITTDDMSDIQLGDYFIYAGREIKRCEVPFKDFTPSARQKIIATTDPELNLPQPSKEFIEEYCRVGGIDEVDIEYGLFHDGNFKDDDETHAFKDIRKPKVNSNNEIIIHPVEDKMYTKEEVEELCQKAFTHYHNNKMTQGHFEIWKQENIK